MKKNRIDICFFKNPLFKKDIIQLYKFDKKKKLMNIIKF